MKNFVTIQSNLRIECNLIFTVAILKSVNNCYGGAFDKYFKHCRTDCFNEILDNLSWSLHFPRRKKFSRSFVSGSWKKISLIKDDFEF